ncbi:MAG TPA: hypothetical protein H9684_01990 [Firmicutes bacterium]|nr:hypothetical protein [Bacillota bacterium]
MRIIIDTEAKAIVVPEKYYLTIDKMNEIVNLTGGNKLDYTQFIKDQFAACIGNIKRPSDIVKPRPKEKKKKEEK